MYFGQSSSRNCECCPPVPLHQRVTMNVVLNHQKYRGWTGDDGRFSKNTSATFALHSVLDDDYDEWGVRWYGRWVTLVGQVVGRQDWPCKVHIFWKPWPRLFNGLGSLSRWPSHFTKDWLNGFSASWESSVCERKLHYPGNAILCIKIQKLGDSPQPL